MAHGAATAFTSCLRRPRESRSTSLSSPRLGPVREPRGAMRYRWALPMGATDGVWRSGDDMAATVWIPPITGVCYVGGLTSRRSRGAGPNNVCLSPT